MIILKYYIILLFFSLMLMKTTARKYWIYSLKNYSYYYWMACQNFSVDEKNYVFDNVVMGIIFIFLFPIICFIDPNNWKQKFGGKRGELLMLPISLNNDDKNYSLTSNMQSKLFWFDTFVKNKINTPKVICRSQHEPYNSKFDINKSYIAKPNYGTDGSDIIKTTYKKYKLTNFKTIMILQEFHTDCFTKKSRHFRIVTQFKNNNSQLFYTIELKQSKKNIVVSNKSNGGISKICKNNICSFLSSKEILFLNEINTKLLKLHKKMFSIVPFIGWDIILTCDGPFALEGNIGAGMKFDDEMYELYCDEIEKEYE
jgi:hypothetical protein